MDATTSGEAVSSSQISVRDRIFAVLTANVAVAFALAGWYCCEQYVLKVNSTRVLELEVLRLESKILTTRPGAAAADEARRADRRKQLGEQIGTTLVIATVWKFLMYVTAAILEAAAFLGTTRHGRRAHLVAGWAVLISTVCTVVAMTLLVAPSFGGMESLARRSYVYIALIQGGYGAILLAVFWSRKRQTT